MEQAKAATAPEPDAHPAPARGLLGPKLTLKELNLICWGLFFAFLVLPFCTVVVVHSRSGQPLLHDPEVDFVYFYSLGSILNQHPPGDLYNYDTQLRMFNKVRPLKTGNYGPSYYAPFIAILFRPFALLPYTTAYLLWVGAAFLLYVAGLALLTTRFFPGDGLRQSLIFCFALSYYPFVNWTLMSGHISVIGFLAFAVAFREEDRDRPFLSGLALSVCAYKPTMLFLFLPMLIIGRRWRNLSGFFTGAAALALFSTGVEGFSVWKGYLAGLFSFAAGSASVHTHSFKQLWKYVDLASFLSAEHGMAFPFVLALVLGFGGWAGFHLVRVWWTSKQLDRRSRMLLWASTLTLTLLLNVYVPIYDSILVVIGAIATAGILRHFPGQSMARWFTLLWLLILAGSWVTVSVAETTGFQMITVLLACLGIVQLALLHRATNLPESGRTA